VSKLICFRCRRLHLRTCACGRIHSALRAKHWNLLRRAVEHYDEGIVTKYAETAKALEERGLVRIFGKPFRGKVKVFARQAGRELHITRTADEACETARKVIEGLTIEHKVEIRTPYSPGTAISIGQAGREIGDL